MRHIYIYKAQYKDVNRRTMGVPHYADIFKANCSLKFHNATLKLPLPISEKGTETVQYENINLLAFCWNFRRIQKDGR